MTKREAALREFIKLIGTTEVGGNNRGPVVDKIESADSLPGIGYAWCQSAVNYAWKLATGDMLAGGTASVGLFVSWAKSKGYVVTRPYRGDHVAYQFDSDNWPDHVGMVEKVLQLGPTFILQTIEGNTSSGEAGSQDDGDGIYRRRRIVRASRVVFVRVPGDMPPPVPTKVVYEIRNNGVLLATSDPATIGDLTERASLGRFLSNRNSLLTRTLAADPDGSLQLVRRKVDPV